MYCGWTMSPALGTVDFGNGVTVAASNDSAAGIVKYAADGKAEWASAPVVGSHCSYLDASLDGSVLVVLCGGNPGTLARVGTSGMQTGAVLWQQPTDSLMQRMIVSDDNNDVYVAASVADKPLLLNDTSGNAVVLRSRGSWDLAMLKYDATYGTPTWATSGGGPGMEYFVSSIATDPDTHGIFFGGYTRCATGPQHIVAPPPCSCALPPALRALVVPRMLHESHSLPPAPWCQVGADRLGRNRACQPLCG